MSILHNMWHKILGMWKIGKKPEASKVSLPIGLVKKEVRTITVGIDFGTSSTKVLWFDETRRKRYVAFYEDSHIEGYPPYCIPSSVGIKDLLLYFGTAAEHSCAGENIYRSTKSDIGRDIKYDVGNKCGINNEQEIAMQIAPIIFATLYIGFIIQQIKKQLDTHYEGKYELNTTFNMAAPLDHLNHADMETKWEQILYYGEKLSSGIHNEMSLTDAINLYENVKKNNPFIKDPQYSCTFVFPETVSAIVSYLNSGKPENGLFGIVDIGAGSTDISFFRHYESQVELKESFYAAKSEMIAMDDFDKAIMSMIYSEQNIRDSEKGPEAQRVLLHRIRCAKASMGPNGLSLANDNIMVGKDAIERATKNVRQRIVQCYRRTLGEAFKKEMRQERWNKWTLFLIGGGSRLEMIQRDFECCLGTQINDPRRLKIEIEGRVGLPNGSAEIKWTDEMISLLAIAYGLSINKLNWPAWAYPKDVSTLEPRKVKQRTDREELYPK